MSKTYILPKEAITWVTHLKREQWADKTVHAYSMDIHQLFVYTKKTPLNITKQDINNFLYSSKSPATFERRRASIRKFMNWLVSEEYRSDNPALVLGVMKSNPDEAPKFLMPDELKKLKAKVDDSGNLRNIAIMSVFMNLGLRESEVRNLDIINVNKTGEYISILKSKGGKSRTIPLPKSTQQDIRNYLNIRKDKNPALFVSKYGVRISRSQIVNIVKGFYNEIGKGDMGLTVHSLRHSTCTGLILGGMDIVFVAEILGHNSISTTQHYTHIVKEELKKKSLDLLG
jgi:integrase/recombinase XerD